MTEMFALENTTAQKGLSVRSEGGQNRIGRLLSGRLLRSGQAICRWTPQLVRSYTRVRRTRKRQTCSAEQLAHQHRSQSEGHKFPSCHGDWTSAVSAEHLAGLDHYFGAPNLIGSADLEETLGRLTGGTFVPQPACYISDLPIFVANTSGMVKDDAPPSNTPKRRGSRRALQEVKVVRKQHEPRRYVSKHFSPEKPMVAESRAVREHTHRRKHDVKVEEVEDQDATTLSTEADRQMVDDTSEPSLGRKDNSRVCHGLNLDDLSSDSDLTDVPDDIGSNPFYSDEDLPPPTVLRALQANSTTAGRNRKRKSKLKPKTKSKAQPNTSPYFPGPPRHAHRTTFLATLPFPPISDEHFGLMQEKLAHNPYRLLLATIFLNKTPGMRAMPIFYSLMEQYKEPNDLAQARVEDVTEIIRELGFQNQRARKCVALAKVWVQNPPRVGQRYRKLNYPVKGDGRDVKEGESTDDADPRVAWEISHLPGLGPYSHDSWRMFCRDTLRGQADDWLGRGAVDPSTFEPEWKRVLPMDKELRAWMTWMWLKEGWVWNKETGERTKADDELMRLAKGGGVIQEPRESNHLIVSSLEETTELDKVRVEHPAGDFVPS